MKLSKISTRGDDKYAGIEPSWKEQQGTKSEMMSAFNWYNYFCGKKEAKTFVIEYLQSLSKKEEVSTISSLPDSQFNLQLGWLARMMCLGYKPDDETIQFFKNEFDETMVKAKFAKANKVVEKPATAQVVNIQERITEKARDEMGELEGFIDDFVLNGCKSKVDIANFMKSRQYSSVVAKRICDTFIGRAKELEEVLDGNDDQLKEGYSNFSKPELKRFKELLDTIVSESNRLGDANKPIRKKRKIKEKPATVLVSKMNYMQEFPELNLKSVQPEKLIGAMQIWTYNTKTKLLGVYNADNAKGITVKGSTLQNFNEQTSIGKRLRKPEIVLPNLLSAGKVQIKKILPDLTTKESTLTGRMNSDTLIVRIL
jgi:hypothetical protein